MRVGPIGLSMWEIDTPALCLDIAAVERNIAQLATFLKDKPAAARPHVKTHKSPAIAWLQLRAGAIGITCAKVSEAEVMAQAGIRDILIANQVVGADKIARLVNLAATTEVMVAVDDLANAQELSVAAQAKKVRLRVLVEVDVGMHRCGVAPGAEALALAREVVKLPGLRFEGLMGYEGHAVMIPDLAERTRVAHEAMAQLIATRDLLLAEGIPVGIVSAGGTGTYAITGAYPGVTEIQAGSYATMDAKYREVGMDFELALSVMARVISVRGMDDAVIDAGMKTLSPEFGMPMVARPEGWTLVRLSEEHGQLRRQGGAPLRRGDRVQLIPGHGCTTINLHDVYHVTRDGVVEAVWPVAARGCVR
jgi:D-serine deaminase-like pyridoxal phosphate-dependent protein